MMKLSRQTRIIILLVLNTIYFLAEIIIGYRVGSLALIADSFHMLNDMISLIIALWAVRVAARTEWDSKYSYGWQRAEVLGALINGVFLVALCFTLLIDCIERFVNPQVITEPLWVLITGCAGLAANIFGLVLFHDHGHSHGHSHGPSQDLEQHIADLDVSATPSTTDIGRVENHGYRQPSRDKEIDIMSVHPAIARDATIEQVRSANLDLSASVEGQVHNHGIESQNYQEARSEHSHGNLNMRGVFLHVLGDALGNIGVIISALIIWLTTFNGRFYFDPLISLLITIIIFSSALPLVRKTSFILLQGVPSTIAIDDVRRDLCQTDDILSVHELHIWQLSDTKMIASLHVLLSSTANYMNVAKRIRKLMHKHGIHSTTIQPEFVDDSEVTEELLKSNFGSVRSPSIAARNQPQLSLGWRRLFRWRNPEARAEDAEHEGAYDSMSQAAPCLLRCSEDGGCAEKACCPSLKPASSADSII